MPGMRGDVEHRFWRFIPGCWRPDICWEWQGAKDGCGYGVITVQAGKVLKAHRLAYEIFNSPIPTGLVVRHKCDNKPCVNPRHLELGTPRQNTQDAIRRGLRSNTCSRCGCPHSARTRGCAACAQRHRQRMLRGESAIKYPSGGQVGQVRRGIRHRKNRESIVAALALAVQ